MPKKCNIVVQGSKELAWYRVVQYIGAFKKQCTIVNFGVVPMAARVNE